MFGVHVYPLDDWIEHDLLGDECLCEPNVIYIDSETGLTFEDGPLIVHNRVASQIDDAQQKET